MRLLTLECVIEELSEVTTELTALDIEPMDFCEATVPFVRCFAARSVWCPSETTVRIPMPWLRGQEW